MSSGRFALLLIFWCGLYFISGYISLYLDDPSSRIAFVWFPAGVAVSAFLLTKHRFWLPLFLALFIVRTLLDITMHHTLATSLVYSAISLTNDISIAWCVLHFARPNDALHSVIIWVCATLITSAIAAVLGTSWLALRHSVDFIQTWWIWWAANVVGTILLTTIVMGLCWKQEPFSLHKGLIGGLLWLLLCVSSWYIFHQPIGGPSGQAILFSLACIPVALMITIPILSDNRLAAFALLCFSIIVIYYSWQRFGPFFIQGLLPGEPLLLAQCYLSGTALLLSFIYVQKRSVIKQASLQKSANWIDSGPSHACYYFEPASGHLTWDESLATELSQQLAQINHVDQLLAQLSPNDQALIQQRWKTVQNGGTVNDRFHFLLALTPTQKISLQETKLIGLQRPDGMVLIGYWSEDFHKGYIHPFQKR